MTAERANAIESQSEPPSRSSHNRSNHRLQDSLAVAPSQLKIAERPARNRVQRLLDLTDTLLRETETLARDKAFTDQSNRLRALNIAEGIDFYDEVERFETGLIRLALEQTGGHQ